MFAPRIHSLKGNFELLHARKQKGNRGAARRGRADNAGSSRAVQVNLSAESRIDKIRASREDQNARQSGNFNLLLGRFAFELISIDTPVRQRQKTKSQAVRDELRQR